ncbi:hypothetical protein T484DRAFT_1783689 [Baffinella frigidus]|nr:hypothetical protein T484DRAFT_1783689 [Cryptophyta sp. CCMP2293]
MMSRMILLTAFAAAASAFAPPTPALRSSPSLAATRRAPSQGLQRSGATSLHASAINDQVLNLAAKANVILLAYDTDGAYKQS